MHDEAILSYGGRGNYSIGSEWGMFQMPISKRTAHETFTEEIKKISSVSFQSQPIVYLKKNILTMGFIKMFL